MQWKIQIFVKSLAIYASDDLIFVLVMLLRSLGMEFEGPRFRVVTPTLEKWPIWLRKKSPCQQFY